jgi:outer membrane receptor protein involved in Fe transport
VRSICAPITVLIWLLAPVPALANEAPFVGRVVNQQSRAAVPGATVSIVGLPGMVKTDQEGRFTWAPPPAPPFQVIVILAGGQVVHPVSVERLDGKPIDIPVNPLADESLTVVGAAPSVTIAPAAGTTLLSSLQLARRAPENLLQALETVPGVNQVSEGHAGVPAIRGMARGRTLLLIDGGRVTSERRVGPSATFADPIAFEGIDVARGPGSVAYGSDALGGVISVRTRRAEPGSPLRIRGSATLGGGIPERRGHFEVSKGFAAGGVLAQVHARDSDDWASPEDASRVFNSGWRDLGFLVRADGELGRGVLSATLQNDFARDVERPRSNSRTVRFYNPYEDSHRVSGAYELTHTSNFQRLAITGFLGSFTQRTDQDRFATASSGRSIERADMSARDFQIKGSGSTALGPARVEFGVDVNGRFGLEAEDWAISYDTSGNPIGEAVTVSIDSSRRTNAGAYLQSHTTVHQKFRLSGGVRGDRVTTRNSGGHFGTRATANGAFSGFGSVVAGPFSGFTMTGQLSRGFRDPALSDRYFRGPTGRGFITGNPDLQPETSLQLDLALRYVVSRTQLALYAYQYRIDDLVERYMTDVDFFYFRNRGRARIRGVELETRTDLGRGFAVELGGTISRGVASDDAVALDDIAPDTITALVQKDFREGAFVQLRTALRAADDRPGPTEIETPAARIVDLAAGYRLTENFELRGNVRNLLDDSYFASPDPRWVYAAGRSASVTLALQY